MQKKVEKLIIEGVTYVPEGEQSVQFNQFEGLDSLVGVKLFIRTVTYHCTGKVVGIKDGFIMLEDSAWIADSGRFADALETGKLDEVEPTKKMWVAISAIVDFFIWEHDLPIIQK